jgi:hypothetical protein
MRYALNKTNEADKAAIIADMGAIYSDSILTIVVSTNSDPPAGLLRVLSAPQTQTQIRKSVKGLQLAVVFHDNRRPFAKGENSV